jgi:hypothetical protein
MKTLYEKLSPANRKKLDGKTEKHYFLIQILKTKVAWTDLKVYEMMQLFEALEIKEFNFITPLDNLFYGK